MAPHALRVEEPLELPVADPVIATKKSQQPLYRSDYEIPEQPLGTRRPLRVICLGAGYSGLMMAIVFSQKLNSHNASFVIYERNSDLGGTWLENRYPGCQCDIPAHNYAFSFEPNPEWPNYYATAEQIYAYIKRTANKYDVDKYIKYNHSISRASWDDARGKWKIKVQSQGSVFEDECDVFINAGGILNKWKWPNIHGLHNFEGALIHSANWDRSYDFEGKRVAVIGIGSSGIQVVPKLRKVAKSLDLFIRTQVWVSPAPGINEPTDNDPDMDDHYNFTQETLDKFKADPGYLLEHRRAILDRRISNFKRAMAESQGQMNAQAMFRKSMTERLGNSEKGKALAKLLLPSFPVGCRRQTPGPGFLEALLEDNVETHWDDIAAITKKGILRKDGTETQYDVIVCATGFDTSFQPAFPLIGRNGSDLAQLWTEGLPRAYFGITVPEFPNYFSFIGPNSPISNGSLVLSMQATGLYIYKFIDRLQTEGIRDFEISHEANDDYNEHMQKYLERTVWVGGCRSWYKRGTVDGPVVAIYGGTTFHFMELLKNPRWEDYNIRRLTRNRFAYLGDGFTLRETKEGSVGATQTMNFEDFWKLFVLPEVHN